jgi:SAM-dependent methyltransferase
MAGDSGVGQTVRNNGDPWAYIQDWDVDAAGPTILEAEERGRWSNAFRRAGGLPYMWHELAANISDIVYALLELRPGDRVLIIGEAVEPCGWKDGLEAIVGETGQVDAVEIIRQGRETIRRGERGRNGMVGCWRWDYTKEESPETYDAIAIMQSAQHCDEWAEAGAELLRVLKPGRRIVSAEALMQGPAFVSHINSDVHIQSWYDKMAAALPYSSDEISWYTAEQLAQIFGDMVQDARAMEWRGIELFWGRKPGGAGARA